MSLHVAAYDISRSSSRRNIARILLRYGRRVQESVYEIDVESEDLRELKRAVAPWLSKLDRFDVFPVDTRRSQARVRWQSSPYGETVRLF